MVEEPLVHHLATVPLFIIPAQVLSLSGKLSRQGGDLRSGDTGRVFQSVKNWHHRRAELGLRCVL